MSDLSNRIDKEFDKLKQHRDELRVQLNLGKKEVEDRWEAIDERWGQLEQKMKLWGRLSKETVGEVADAAEDVAEQAKEGLELTAEEVGDSAKKLIAEIREGYDRLRNS